MRQGNLIGPIVVAIGVIIAAIAFAVVSTLLETADSGNAMRISRLEEQLKAEADARGALDAEVQQVKADMAQLLENVSTMAKAPPPVATAEVGAPAPAAAATSGAAGGSASDFADEDFEHPPPISQMTEQMKLAKSRFNRGITQPRNVTMLELFGPPRDNYTNDCLPITNPKLKSLIETRRIGPLNVSMLKPVLDSLQRVVDRLQKEEPDIYASLGTAGTICARLIRGSTTSISNHSWGTAIDLTLQGKLDPFGDGGTQAGTRHSGRVLQ